MSEQRGGAIEGIRVEEAVLQRYERAAQQAEAGLCVPVSYDQSFLEALPE